MRFTMDPSRFGDGGTMPRGAPTLAGIGAVIDIFRDAGNASSLILNTLYLFQYDLEDWLCHSDLNLWDDFLSGTTCVPNK